MLVASPAPATTHVPDGAPSSGEPGALAMLVRVGGLRLVRELVELYLSYAPARLQEARRAAEQGDSAGVRRACHALRSGSAQLGLVATARHCLAAERGDGDPAGLPALVREIERAHGEGMAWLTRHLESLEAA